MKNIFVFSGLGADKRVFANLKIDGFQLQHIVWIEPLNDESITDYAKRTAAKIDEPNPVLMGLSFGGMMAIEVSKLIAVEKLILLSTVKTREEMPILMKISSTFHFNNFIPKEIPKPLNMLSTWAFGLSTDEEKKMFEEILKDTNSALISWSLNQVTHWQNEIPPKNYLHLHGTSDLIFPFENIKNATPIAHGGHFMVWNKADEISAKITKYLTL